MDRDADRSGAEKQQSRVSAHSQGHFRAA